jgi:hypothetical protein
MTADEDAPPKSKMSQKTQRVIGVALIAIVALLVILDFAVSPRVANAFTAVATISLAVATVWLGQQTRKAVEVSENEMAQNRETLSLTRQQADDAKMSTNILVESNRPFVSLGQGIPLGIVDTGENYVVEIPVHNYGASVAFIETGNHCPSAILARNGDRFSLGVPDTVVLPKDTNGTIVFTFDRVSRAGGPVLRPDGSYIALTVDFWFTDVSKTTHYLVHAEFDPIPNDINKFNGGLRLTNIEFGPSLPIDIDGLDPRSLPQWVLDQKTSS